MKSSYHALYIIGSIVAALVAAVGIAAGQPIVYGVVPGVIGGVLTALAAVQFFGYKQDLPGFVATACGFVFYQAYQMNPVTLPEFTAYIASIPVQDQIVGIILANLTTAILLGAYHAVSGVLGGTLDRWLPQPAAASRRNIDDLIAFGFAILFILVALPNVLFGKVVVGPIETIINQRAAWADPSLSGYAVFGGALGGSFANIGLWAASLFLIWLYLLGSKFRWVAWILSPLVLLWTAAVALQGSRTYLVTLALGFLIYALGSPKVGRRAFFHMAWALPLTLTLLQISTLFRTTGITGFDASEFATHALEIRGNEGASSEMDGVEYFRTELVDRGIAPNPLTGFFRGLFERPVEGLLMIVPRSAFPWKPDDQSAIEYNLFFENVRLGVPTEEVFLGASPGLMGRELIRYGYLGPVTLLLWMGLLLALANRFYAADPASPFHRICAASLVVFFIAQSRDFVPVWFIPFLPVGVILGLVSLRARKWNRRARSVGAPGRVHPTGAATVR